jgi:hypothetical protein
MTIKQTIDAVNDIKPHAFNNDTLTMWLNEVEGMVQTDVMLVSSFDVISYDYNNNKDTELLVKAPHSKIYVYYLAAMIDFANNEYDKYQNTMEAFNKFFSDYMRWYSLNVNPANGRADIVGYYITAYAIAVKHGYSGTEEEWIQELNSAGNYSAAAKESANSAEKFANSAEASAVASKKSENSAKEYKDAADNYSKISSEASTEAESWARGETGIRAGEDTDNALYYCNKAWEHETNASKSANSSESSARAAAESANSSELSAIAAAESSDYASGVKRDVDVIRNDAYQHKLDAEQYALQAKENAETINPLYSNALKGKVTGTNVVRLDDVSPLRQDINITTDVPTTFKSYGKNLCDVSKISARDTVNESVTQIDSTTFVWDGSYYFEVTISLPAGTTFTYSWGALTQNYTSTPVNINSAIIVYTDGTVSKPMSITYPLTAEKDVQKIRIYKNVVDKFTVTIKNLQIEVGNARTEFEVFKEPVNDIVSVHPVTTLIADTLGVEITAEYNKDINGVIKKQQAQIDELKAIILELTT